MKKFLLTILIVCLASTVGAQSVVKRPASKKPATHTATKPAVRQPVKTVKKPVSASSRLTSVQTTKSRDSAEEKPQAKKQLSESAKQLKNMLERPLGTARNAFAERNMSAIYQELSSGYNCYKAEREKNLVIVYPDKNPQLLGLYQGIPFHYFRCEANPTYSWAYSFNYCFEIEESAIQGSIYDYCDRICADFNELGIPLTYSRKQEKYLKAKGELKKDGIDLEFEVNKFSSDYQFEIRIYADKDSAPMSEWLNSQQNASYK